MSLVFLRRAEIATTLEVLSCFRFHECVKLRQETRKNLQGGAILNRLTSEDKKASLKYTSISA